MEKNNRNMFVLILLKQPPTFPFGGWVKSPMMKFGDAIWATFQIGAHQKQA